MRVEVGDKVKDSMTGFKGVAVARCEYLNGCVSIEIQPVKLNNGAMLETKWIDEQQLIGESKAGNGGPQSRPTGLSTPR